MAITIEDMFAKSRFPSGLQFLIFLLYVPVGLVLALLRVFIGFHAFLVATVLPKTLFLRRLALRVMCTILGVVIRSQVDEPATAGEAGGLNENNRRSLMVANSVSVFDHLVLDLLTPNYVLINKPCDGFWSWFGGYFSPRDSRVSLTDCIRYFLRDSSVDLVAFPEGASTNGRAMLKFQDWPFDLGLAIRPVTIKIYRPTLNVAVTLAGSRCWQDAFWHLFSPMTMYRVRFLPLQKRQDNESVSDFTKRIQTLMCDSSQTALTKFTMNDKKELVKRQKFEERRQKNNEGHSSGSPGRAFASRTTDDRLRVWCRQVKDVLPDVPLHVIERDLRTTKNVDVTITNLLEGVTHYTPESQAVTAVSSGIVNYPTTVTATSSTTPNSAAKTFPAAVPAKNFSRSSRDRHLSLAERKQQLIENSRARYLEKYGSQTS